MGEVTSYEEELKGRGQFHSTDKELASERSFPQAGVTASTYGEAQQQRIQDKESTHNHTNETKQ